MCNALGSLYINIKEGRKVKKNILKKIIVSVLSLSLAFSFQAPILAAGHAANGADVMPKTGKWSSFSICTREDGGAWEDSLKKVFETNDDGTYKLDENGNKIPFQKGIDYATEGYFPAGWENTSKSFHYWMKNSGWDGEYAITDFKTKKSELVADNPWGMTLEYKGIPVEFGRYYTLEFDIGGYLQMAKYNKETGVTSYVPSDKHILVKAYDYQSSGGPAAAFETVENGSTGGIINIVQSPDADHVNYTHVKATFKIPDTKEEWGGGIDKGAYTKMGIMFALGANLVSYKDEIALKGDVFVKNVKVTAGTQHTIKYYDGSKLKATKYVNEEENAKSVALTKKGYTLGGYTNMATGSRFSFATTIYKDYNLKAIWNKTPKPAKGKISAKSKKKKQVTVTFKKNKNAKGYQVKYSYNKKFKKKKKYKTKTKTTTSTSSYKIKSLKRSSIIYIKARAFNKDSTGAKIYGKWSKRKTVYVK